MDNNELLIKKIIEKAEGQTQWTPPFYPPNALYVPICKSTSDHFGV